MKADHPLIVKSLRRARCSFLFLAALTMPVGAFMLAAPLWSTEGHAIMFAAVGLGLLFFGFGVFALWMCVRYWDPARSPVMEVLRDRPHQIVWIYDQEIESRVAGATVARAHHIHLQLENGKGLKLSVASPDRDEVLTLLGRLAPRATFGYSRELRKQYKRDPRSVAATIG